MISSNTDYLIAKIQRLFHTIKKNTSFFKICRSNCFSSSFPFVFFRKAEPICFYVLPFLRMRTSPISYTGKP